MLVDLRAGRLPDARALPEDDGWRSLNMGGLPHPVLHPLAGALDRAAATLDDDAGYTKTVLLTARARFLPGG